MDVLYVKYGYLTYVFRSRNIDYYLITPCIFQLIFKLYLQKYKTFFGHLLLWLLQIEKKTWISPIVNAYFW